MTIHAFGYFLVIAAMGFLTYFGNMTLARVGLQIVTRIKKDLFSHLLTLPLSYFDRHPVGELMSRTESDTERVRDLFSTIGVTLVNSVLFLMGMLIVCSLSEPRITAGMAIGIVAALAIVIVFFDKLRGYYDRSRQLTAKVNARITEFVQGVEVLKAFGRVPWAEAALDADAKVKRDNDVRSSMLEYSAMAGLGFLIGPAFMAAVIILLAPKILLGTLTLGTLFVFLEYGRQLLDPLMGIAENIRSVQQARVSLSRIFGILDLAPEDNSGTTAPAFDAEIEFRHVWFRYRKDEGKEAEAAPWALRDVSFRIPKGRTLAFVGPSGSGKSTVIALLCRFYEPDKGEILVDGVPLAKLDLPAWRSKMGLVLQDVYLFPGSVLENVRIYNDRIDRGMVQKSLETVQAGDLVAKLPNNLDSEIHERGGNVSGGEKQLLSFARAVAFGPEIVVLDEATASIDVKTERKIKDGMASLLKGRTAVIVAHRLSSILNADEILFMKDGRIAARGRHPELLAGFPEYAELVRLQLLGGQGRDQEVATAMEED
jgi:ABC-type multidrug transport system fused ATPase/permease subunit